MTLQSRRAVLRTMLTAPVFGSLAIHHTSAQSTPEPSDGSVVPAVTTGAQVIVLSSSAPHVTVIDPATNEVVASNEFPDFPGWTWNDDYNYYDGRLLWLGSKHPETHDSWIRSLDLGSLELVDEISTGIEEMTLYTSRGTSDGRFYVGKMGAGQVLAIDPASAAIVETWDVPVNEGVVCDIDVYTGPDGVERIYYPTWTGDTVVSINPVTGDPETVTEDFPDGGGPWMNTVGPDGRLWVQWQGNTNDVLDAADLSLVKRIPVGEQPTNVTFSPDGRFAYISHLADNIVTVVDVETLEKITDIQVGTDASHVAVNTDGATIYAIANKEGAVAVIDTTTWEVTQRINLGTNPSSVFFRAGS